MEESTEATRPRAPPATCTSPWELTLTPHHAPKQVAKAAGAGAGKALEKASAAIPAAALSAAVFLTTAGPAHAEPPVAEAKQFLEAFWKFRTGDATSFVCLTILPILGPYVIFQFFIDKKKLRHKATLAEGKWDVFMVGAWHATNPPDRTADQWLLSPPNCNL